MESSESFGIYRRFGNAHSRILLKHMSSIQEMLTELRKIDRSDEEGGINTNWRLKNRFHTEGLDTTKRELENRLEQELLAYGNIVSSPSTGKESSLAPVSRYATFEVQRYQVHEPYTSTRP